MKKSKSLKDRNSYLVYIGADSALFSKELAKIGLVEKAVALDTGYADIQLVTENKIEYFQSGKYSCFNHFLMIDVLEHIENDADFLTYIVRAAHKGAHFNITVPANRSLWSGHDVYLNYFRRYRKKELRELN